MKLLELNPHTVQIIRTIVLEVMASQRRRFRANRSTPIQPGATRSPVIINPFQKETENNIYKDDPNHFHGFAAKKLFKKTVSTEKVVPHS